MKRFGQFKFKIRRKASTKSLKPFVVGGLLQVSDFIAEQFILLSQLFNSDDVKYRGILRTSLIVAAKDRVIVVSAVVEDTVPLQIRLATVRSAVGGLRDCAVTIKSEKSVVRAVMMIVLTVRACKKGIVSRQPRSIELYGTNRIAAIAAQSIL